MTDRPRRSNTQPESGSGIDPEAHPGMPRWVKVTGVIAAILVLALLAIMFVGGGDHGPSRHATADQKSDQLPLRASAWGHG